MKKILLTLVLTLALILPAVAQNGIKQDFNQTKAIYKAAPNVSDPYLRELERRIKRNFYAQKYERPFRIVVEFQILHNGKLKGFKFIESSGDKTLDNIAKAAVELTAPFAPLPPQYKGDWVDVQMMFWQTN